MSSVAVWMDDDGRSVHEIVASFDLPHPPTYPPRARANDGRRDSSNTESELLHLAERRRTVGALSRPDRKGSTEQLSMSRGRAPTITKVLRPVDSAGDAIGADTGVGIGIGYGTGRKDGAASESKQDVVSTELPPSREQRSISTLSSEGASCSRTAPFLSPFPTEPSESPTRAGFAPTVFYTEQERPRWANEGYLHLIDDLLAFALGHQLNIKYPTVDGIFMSNRSDPEQPEFDPGDSDDEDGCLCTIFTRVDEMRSKGLKVANK